MFETIFNPASDVVYGLDAERQEYIDAWIEWHKKNVGTGGVNTSRFMINYFNAPLLKINPLQPKTYGPLNQINLIEVMNYINRLRKTRFAPEYVAPVETIPRLADGNRALPTDLPGILAFVKKSADNNDEVIAASIFLAIRRACKFGIEYVTQVNNGTVHYVLDGINMTDVIGRLDRPRPGNIRGVPITTSELRYLFRNWHRLQALHDTRKLIFWRNRAPALPPWESDPKSWLVYAQHRLEKNLVLLTSDKQHVDEFKAFLKSDPARSLKAFFRVATGRELL